MASFTYTINNSVVPEIVDAMAFHFNYDLNKRSNTETKAQFAERMVLETIRQKVKRAVVLYRNSLVPETSIVVESDYQNKIT